MTCLKTLLIVAAVIRSFSAGPVLFASEKGPSPEFPVAVSPNGKLLAAGNTGSNSYERAVRIMALDTQKELRRFKLPNAERDVLMSLAFSPDGKLLAWGGYGKVHLLNPESGERLRVLKGYATNAKSVAFSPDGKLLAVNGGKHVHVWGVANGTKVRDVGPHLGWVLSLAYSPDGKSLASASQHDVYLWESASGKQVLHIKLVGRISVRVRSLAFSPDGKMLLVGSYDRIRLLEVASGREIRQVDSKTVFYQVGFAPDGKTFAGRDYSSVRTWETVTGRPIRTFVLPEAPKPRNEIDDIFGDYFHYFAFTPDGKKLVMTYRGRGLGVWNINR